MNNQQLLSIDCTKGEDFLKFYPNKSFIKVCETGLPGKGLTHASHHACEYKEHSYQQHGIFVHLKPEYHSLRRLGDSVKVENPNVGDIAIIPGNVNHWQRIDTPVVEGIAVSCI